MAKIDEKIVSPPAPQPSIKPVDKKANFAKNAAKQQKVNVTKPVVNKGQTANRRTGKR